MEVGFSIDPAQGLSPDEELGCVSRGAELGYRSAWTPARGDEVAFDRCLAWQRSTGLTTGVAVVPASAQPPAFYAQQATRIWNETEGRFVLGVGSGRMLHPAKEMRPYLEELRRSLPPALPLYVAALGPEMLDLAGELADGVSLNWCTADQVAWSRARVERAASRAGRPTPPIASYIRTAVDPDPEVAAVALGTAMRDYALGPVVYRKHFERMGFASQLARLDRPGARPRAKLISAVGAWGVGDQVRPQFLRLAQGLDCAIVRVLVSQPGDAASARRVLEECRP